MSVEKRVARGAELLDDWVPGWASRVDVEGLDMGDANDCVLGQLYEKYDLGRKELGITHGMAISYGFQTRWRLVVAQWEYRWLGDAWHWEIKERLWALEGAKELVHG